MLRKPELASSLHWVESWRSETRSLESIQWHGSIVNEGCIKSTGSSLDVSSLNPDSQSREQSWVMPFPLDVHLIAAAKGQVSVRWSSQMTFWYKEDVETASNLKNIQVRICTSLKLAYSIWLTKIHMHLFQENSWMI